MKKIVTTILTIIFLAIGVIHYYWAFGGKWGFKSVIPTNQSGMPMLNPQTIDSIVVGTVLVFLGLFYALLLRPINSKIVNSIKKRGIWFIPILFMVRAVGDFKYVGFFKQIKGTEFANLDTLYFSPLCLGIGVLGFLLIKLK